MVRKVIYQGSVDYLQVVDEQGNVDKALEPKLSNEELDKMFRLMVLTREFDRKALSLQRQGRIFTYAPVEGQEGAQIGIGTATKKEDRMFPSYREHGIAFSRGADLVKFWMAWMGVEGVIPPESGDFPIAIPIGSQALHAAGAGWAAQILKQKHVCVTFFGDGATSEGDVHEGMNFAGVKKAPVIFICQNNQYAISVSRKLQTGSETIAQKALAYGFPGVQIDGNDVLAAYVAMKEARERAVAGNGPTLIECITYRFGPHTTADDPTKYRDKAEEEEWRKRDPFVRFRLYLKSKGIWSEDYEQKVVAEVKERVEKAFAEAEATVKVEPQDLFRNVYTVMPEHLKEQMEYLLKIEQEKKEQGKK
jgi:pyruvate dehydrogenase E1 component alpha subunit